MNNATNVTKITYGLDACPAGAHCYFIKLNSLWGAKCYYEGKSCDIAYERQSNCYDEGLAPNVGEKFVVDVDYYDDEEDLQIDKLYCYITELIKPCVPMNYKKDSFVLECECEIFQQEHEKELWEIQEQIKEKTGWHPNDIHGYNWGWNDGKLQLLDFF